MSLWDIGKNLIAGGTQLLSKNPEMFSDNFPAYYKRAKGIKIQDINGKWYTDFSYSGIGSCMCGYANKRINRAVKKAINAGNMCTLNDPHEIDLALIVNQEFGGYKKIRCTRGGGEAMAVAVRIARAYTGKSKVLVSSYHGWHDWYLSANIENRSNLDNHLRKNLNPGGVPKELEGTCIAVKKDYRQIKKIIENDPDIAAFIFEWDRFNVNYLEEAEIGKIIELCKQKGIVTIDDEITNGFRLLEWEIQSLHNPDITVFAKAISNGYPFGLVVGAEKIMDAVKDTFISSTYWTESIGNVAAIATIHEQNRLRREHSLYDYEYKTDIFLKELEEVFLSNGYSVLVHGFQYLVSWHLSVDENMMFDHNAFKRQLTDRMLERGYLISDKIYLTLVHSVADCRKFLKVLSEELKCLEF